jgi:hypothetical protein
MTSHQLRGHTGGNMAGTETYDVCIVFNVHALDDEDALNTVREYLPRGTYPIEWAWIYTTQTKESNATS